jgi:hypothetical protein
MNLSAVHHILLLLIGSIDEQDGKVEFGKDRQFLPRLRHGIMHAVFLSTLHSRFSTAPTLGNSGTATRPVTVHVSTYLVSTSEKSRMSGRVGIQ